MSTSDADALAEVFASGLSVCSRTWPLTVIAVTMLLIDCAWDCCFWCHRFPTLVILVATAVSQGQLPGPRGVVPVMLTFRKICKAWMSSRCSDVRLSTVSASTASGRATAVNGTILFDSSISAFLEWVALGAVAVVLALGGWMVTAGAIGLERSPPSFFIPSVCLTLCARWPSASPGIQGLTAVSGSENC